MNLWRVRATFQPNGWVYAYVLAESSKDAIHRVWPEGVPSNASVTARLA